MLKAFHHCKWCDQGAQVCMVVKRSQVTLHLPCRSPSLPVNSLSSVDLAAGWMQRRPTWWGATTMPTGPRMGSGCRQTACPRPPQARPLPMLPKAPMACTQGSVGVTAHRHVALYTEGAMRVRWSCMWRSQSRTPCCLRCRMPWSNTRLSFGNCAQQGKTCVALRTLARLSTLVMIKHYHD